MAAISLSEHPKPAPITPQNTPLLQMPQDIVAQFWIHSHPQAIGRSARVCKQWNEMLRDDDVWRILFYHHFSSVNPNIIESFQFAYKTLYSNLRKEIYSLHAFKGHKDAVNSLAIAKGQLFSSSDDKTIKVWDIKTGKCITTLNGHEGGVRSIAIVGKKLFSCSSDRTIKVWDIKTYKCTKTLNGHEGGIRSIVVAGKELFSSSDDKTIKVWDIKTGACTATLKGHREGVRSLVVVGRELFSCSDDRTIKAWNIKTGKCTKTFLGHNSGVHSLAIAGKNLFSGSADRTIKVWDIKTGECIATLVGHRNWIRSLIAVDGILFSGSDDNTIKAWDIKTMKCIANLKGHADWIRSLITADGVLYSGSSDNTITAWDFTADHSTVFYEIVELLKSGDQKSINRAIERFSRMPEKAKKAIYEKLHEILKPLEDDYSEIAEHAFHGQHCQSATPIQKAQAISDYLDESTSIESFMSLHNWKAFKENLVN